MKPVTKRCLHVCQGELVLFDLFTALPSTAFAKFGHEVFSKIILGVFVVSKKLVLVKRRAVDQRVCLSTIEQAEPTEFTIQVNAASISFLYLWLLINDSIIRFIFPDNNGILFKKEKSEILESIMNVGCGIELFCDVY